MTIRCQRSSVIALLLAVAWSLDSTAQEQEETRWDQARVIELAGQLHEGVKGLRAETRRTPQDTGTGRAWAYYRLMDKLRLIERETGYLHGTLVKGVGREITRPTYRRIAMLRRDCAEEMARLFVGSTSLMRITQTREIAKQLNSYYGFDPDRDDHEWVRDRSER